MWTIRIARAADAAALSELAESTFRDAFGAQNTREDMDLHCQRSYRPEVQAAEIGDASLETFVAEDRGRLVGYAQVARRSQPACVPEPSAVELRRLYVRREHHGKGLAQELMEAVRTSAIATGSRLLWLGVWERNPRAIAFYRRCGFVEVGHQVFVLGTDPQRDLVMTLALLADDAVGTAPPRGDRVVD